MVEVPEYLLERSKERRAALSGDVDSEGSDGEAKTGEPVAAAADKASSKTSSAPAPPPAGKAPVPIPAAPPPPEISIPQEVIYAKQRKRIPFWVMPVLLFLPLWGFIYVGTLEEPAQSLEGILGEGSHIYQEVAACATCHGVNGTGTNSGPSLVGSELLVTFPDDSQGLGLAQHIEWVVKATDGVGVGRPYGSPEQGRVAGWFGNMPSFGTEVSAYELLASVLHERAVLAGSETSNTRALQIQEALDAGELVLPENWSSDITATEILQILEPALTPSE